LEAAKHYVVTDAPETYPTWNRTSQLPGVLRGVNSPGLGVLIAFTMGVNYSVRQLADED
jgi:hypothetical protein